MIRQVRALGIICAGAVLLASMAAGFAWGGYRVNFTPSYPLGLWQIEMLHRPVAVGDRVFICPPAGSAVNLARERGYLPRGLCPAGTAPLIKTVVAVAGQTIRIEDAVIIDEKPLEASTVHAHDAEGRPLTPWSGGIVPIGELFLHSDFVGSYDSRYFGPLPADGILGLARQVITFAP